jgi:hypothetical protein
MDEAPEKIWVYPTQSRSRIGIWRSDDDIAVSTEYTRSDIADNLRAVVSSLEVYIMQMEDEIERLEARND